MATDNQEEQMQTTMMLLVKAGDAKKQAQEAIEAAHHGDFKGADDKLKTATETLNAAHNTQTTMLTREAQGKPTELTLLTVHAQDHLMTAITYVDLAKEIIRLYRQIASTQK